MFVWSAVWFVVLALDQFTEFVSGPRRDLLDLAQLLLVFGFPPLIVHTMYLEAHVPEWTGPGARLGDARAGRRCTSPRRLAVVGAMALVLRPGAGSEGRRLDWRCAGHRSSRPPAVYSAW